MRVTTHNPDETMRLGVLLAKCLEPGDLVFLQGELGSGKTTFVRGIVEGLEGKSAVTSPTFMLLHLYQGKIPVYHFDFYRLQSVTEVQTLGIDEYLKGDGVSLVEWPEKFAKVLPISNFLVTFQFSKDTDERDIVLTSPDAARSGALDSALIREGGKR